MDDITPGRALRLAVSDTTIAIPGAFNALVGKMIEEAGFEAVYLSGAAFSAGDFALPDIGLFTLTELVEQTRRLTRSVGIPVVVDADTGFGDAVNVERTIVELEAAGAAAVQLEDQRLPKRCGHLSGKSLIGSDEMCAKLRGGSGEMRQRFGDRRPHRLAAVEGFEAAVDRARRYLDAGADWVFPEALADRDEFERFALAVDAPLIANMTEFGKSTLLALDELAQMGYAGVLYPVTLLRVAMKGVEAALATLAADGTQRELLDLMQTRQELYDLLGYDDYEARDRAYFGNGRGDVE